MFRREGSTLTVNQWIHPLGRPRRQGLHERRPSQYALAQRIAHLKASRASDITLRLKSHPTYNGICDNVVC